MPFPIRIAASAVTMLLAMIALPWGIARNAGAEEAAGTLGITWYIAADNVAMVRDTLHWGGEVKPYPETTAADPTKGLPIAYVIVGSVLLPYLADAVIALYRKAAYGAVIVDASGDRIEISNDNRMDGGKIILKTKDGVQILNQNQAPDASRLVELLKATGKVK